MILQGLLLALASVFAAWPLIRWCSPVEPSPLKLGLYSALLSPPLLLALERMASSTVPTPDLPWVVFGVLVGMHLLPVGARVRWVPLGRAAWSALLLATVAAAAVGYLLASGPAMRLTHDGLGWVLGLAQRLAQGGPVEDPWAAGLAPPGGLPFAAVVAAGCRLSGFGPSAIAAGWVVHSTLVLLLAVHLWSAVVWRDGWADTAAPVLFLVCGGVLWSLDPPSPEGGWAVALARLLGDGTAPGAVHLAGSAFLRGGPGVPALAAMAGAGLAVAHGARHGVAPWPLLAGTASTWAALLHPSLGGTLLAAVLVAWLFTGARPARSPRVLAPLLLPWVPALLWLSRSGIDGVPGRVLMPAPAISSAFPLLGAAAVAGARALVRPMPHHADQRRLVLLTGAFAIVLLVTAAGSIDLAGEGPLVLRGATLALAVLAAGLFTQARLPGRAFTLALGVLLLGAGLRTVRYAWPIHERLAASPTAVLDPGGWVTVPAVGARQAALAGLKASELGQTPVLLASASASSERIPPEPGWSALGLSAGAALAFEPEREDARVAARLPQVQALLTGQLPPGVDPAARLGLRGRSLLALVTEEDRKRSLPGDERSGPRGVDDALLRAGWTQLSVVPGAALYHWPGLGAGSGSTAPVESGSPGTAPGSSR